VDTLIRDLRYAVRTLAKSPGFTVVAVLTLALGIGANTAIFSVINAVLLQPLPYAQPDRLVSVNHFYPSLNNLQASVSVPGFRDYSARSDVFTKSAVEQGGAMNVTGEGEPERVNVVRVSGDFFPTLGVGAALGRTLRPDEAQAGRDHEVVLTYGFWKRKFGGDPAVVGRSIRLNDEDYAVVGVMPERFRDFFSSRADLWMPVVFTPDQYADNRRTNEFLGFIGRLAPGVSVEKAQAEMHALARRLRQSYPNSYASDWDLLVRSLNEVATGTIRPALLLLLGAVGFVLLIACANVANLQLARSAARARETAVRVALGASPRRLMRQLLTESVLLSLSGGLVGLLVAAWGLPALLALSPGSLPRGATVRLDSWVLGFTLLVSVLAGLLFGLIPALRLRRSDVHESLKEGGRGAVGERHSLALRRGLVVTTVALALTLLAGAGLLVRSFSRLVAVDPGFQPDHLLTFSVSLPRAKYPNDTVRVAVLERLVAAIRAVPGVVSAGGTSNIPFAGNWSTSSFNVEGYERPPSTPMPWGDMRAVTPGYLPTIRALLRRGRQFTEADRAGGARVCIVDDELVRRYWPNADPIGKRITFNALTDSNITWITVVGVVAHTLHTGFDDEKRVQVYFPLAQNALPFLGLVVRTSGDPMAAAGAVRAAVSSVDGDLPLANINSMDSLLEQTTGPRRFAMLLLTGFAGLAMLLACIGLYGVMSYIVTQRSRELGVRVALGASADDVLRLVLDQGLRLALAGVGIGLVAAFLLTRVANVMRKLLFEVKAYDPVTFVVVPLLLIAVALLASWLPARRATRVDPMEALRAE
jgi:putative ABC transport system permease protein